MPEIPFTQYIRPDGRAKEVTVNRPSKVFEKAVQILKAGLCLETEVLMSGQVSFTIYDPESERDVAIELVPNGPGVSEAIDKMIMEFELE